jgi:hypothetical protein
VHRRRRVFSKADKIRLARLLKQSGVAAKRFEEMHRIPRASIARWLAKIDIFLACDPAGFNGRPGEHKKLEEGLSAWVEQRIRTPGMTVTPGSLANLARRMASMMGIQGFEASRAWVTRFRRRHGLVYVRLRGERASADGDAAREYAFQFTTLYKELKVKTSNIYNFDETLIYGYVATNSTLCPQDIARTIRGSTQRKSRLGMLVTSCADGHNTVPILFANGSRPQGIAQMLKSKTYEEVQKHILRKQHGHYLAKSHNGWVSRDMVVYYLVIVLPNHIRQKTPDDKHALVLMDNCPMHATALFDI